MLKLLNRTDELNEIGQIVSRLDKLENFRNDLEFIEDEDKFIEYNLGDKNKKLFNDVADGLLRIKSKFTMIGKTFEIKSVIVADKTAFVISMKQLYNDKDRDKFPKDRIYKYRNMFNTCMRINKLDLTDECRERSN